jgi:hypothetical protein
MFKINDSDVGYFWDEQWNVSSNEKEQGDKGGETSSSTDKKKDDTKGSR